ncbi:telomerase reverse transcriptase-like [Mytilus trossulus]|uniref:telomerase reverse transcriptase-like n=1 Tax=Mytilus trossulus TaxID=6551 RepID=UPI0030072136
MDIITQLFTHTWTLEEWLTLVDISKNLFQDTDSLQYRDVLKTTIVADQQEEFPTIHSFSQVYQQRELLLHVIQKLKKRNEKNVLIFGFSAASDDIGAQVSHIHNLEYRYPNSCFNRLQYPVWSKLLSRIGDVVMTYLLENTSMFLLVHTSCYVQLTGVPFYDLWPMQPGKYLSIPQKTTNTKSFKRKKKYTQTTSSKKPRYNENQTNINNETKPTTSSQSQANSCSQGNVSRKPETTHNEDLTSNSTVKATNTNDREKAIVDISQANVSRKPEANHNEELNINSSVTITNTYKEDQANINSCSQANVSSKPVNKKDQADIIMDAQTCQKKCFMKATGSSLSIEGLTDIQVHNDKNTMKKSNKEDPQNTTTKLNVALNSCAKQNIIEEIIANIDDELSQQINNSNPQEFTRNDEQLNTWSKTRSCANKETSANAYSDTSAEKISDSIPNQAFTVIVSGKIQNTRQMNDKVSGNNKKKRRKKKKIKYQEFSPYEYHTYINRIQTLYASNLREKFTDNYILNSIPPTEDGAVTLYRHILEHKHTIKASKVTITWKFPENSGNSIGNDSSCCASSTHNMTELVADDNNDIDDHSSFYRTTYSYDKVLTIFNEKDTPKNSKTSSENNPDLTVTEICDANKQKKSQNHVADADIENLISNNLQKPNTKELNAIRTNSVLPIDNYSIASGNRTENSECFQANKIIPEHEKAQGIETSVIDDTLSNSQGFNTYSFEDSQGFETSGNEDSLTIIQKCKESSDNISSFDSKSDIQVIDGNKSLSQSFDSKTFSAESEKSVSILSKVKTEGHGCFTNIKSKKSELCLDNDYIDKQFSSTPLEDNENQSSKPNLSKIDYDDNCPPKSRECRKSLKRKHVDDLEICHPIDKRPRLSLEVSLVQESKESSNKTCVEMEVEETVEEVIEKMNDSSNEIRLPITEEVAPEEERQASKNDIELCKSTVCGDKIASSKGGKCDIHSQRWEEIKDAQCNTIEVDFLPTLCPLLQQILAKHRKCPYKFLLDYYCPAEKPKKKCQIYRRGQKHIGDVKLIKTDSVRENLHKFIPHRQIYLFIRRICLFVIPEDVWGSRRNRNLFTKNIQKLISSNKYDKLCIGQMMSGIKVSSISWLRTVKSNSVRQHIMVKVWHWIIEEFVLDVIKTFFYVTDTTQHVNRLFYYRKRTWQWLHVKALSDLKKRNIIKLITEDSAKQLIIERQSLGVATLRFFPKSKGLRPIINLGRQQTLFGIPGLPINKQLLNLLQVLSLIKKMHPHVVGAAKFGQDEVYRTWKSFAVKQSLPLYFVKTDISSCYDEILQQKLFCIVKNIFNNPEIVEDDFIIRRYVKIVNEGGVIKRKFVRKAFQLGDYRSDFVKFLRHQNQEDNSHNIVFVDQVVTQQETRECLLRQLHCHIFHNIIKIGKTYYKQSKGISQGSVISTLLCNMYYGEMERQFPIYEGEVMMRIVDDALFVTPSKERAFNYYHKMIDGITDFNFSINKSKVQTNFNVSEFTDGITVLKNTEWLSWCGILLNMRTLETSLNLSFYFSSYLVDSMTFDTSYRAGVTMKRKLFRSIRLKCHPLYIDSQLNSINVVIVNIYKILLLSAYKFTQYTKHLAKKDNHCFLEGVITELGHYFYSVYYSAVKHKIHGKNGVILSPGHIQWLCVHAYMVKLNQHRSLYKPLVSCLQRCKVQLNKKMKENFLSPEHLRDICGCELPKEFLRIR